MRFMVIVKADKDSEAGVLPTKEMLTEMGKFNEELVKAGVMLAGEGLQASSKGARVRFGGKGSKKTVIEWLKRAPFENTEIEIRQVFESEDLGEEFTPELRKQEERLREKLAGKK